MATVDIDQVEKRFGQTQVLHGISCAVADGEFVVMVGASGCGKSTLLRIVAGLEKATGGAIAIGGRRVDELEPKDRDVAMVFQNYALYPHMSVAENMGYGLKIRGTPKAEIATRVQRAADILQIAHLLDRKPRQLSGGQRQRVAMGRAIVREPAVFLFDEPLSNLDAQLRVTMRVEIRALQRRLGITALYVTHDQVEAMTMADRLIVMHAGRAEQIGQPLEVYERPATRYVAGFIGSPAMNFVTGTCEGGRVALAGGDTLSVAAAVDGPVVVGFRPEHLAPSDDGPLPLTVELVEPLGADTILHGRLAGAAKHDPLVVVRLPGIARIAPGTPIRVGAAPGAIHLFDPGDGRRLNG
jgi:sn-glycerol 3-phosphate transport system ATP-binding protein